MAKSLVTAIADFGRTTGDYWSKDNAQFEATNPSFGARVGRAINPMSSFGSAVGAMSDAAGNGFNPRETGLALMQALPTFGSALSKTIAGSGAVKASSSLKDISLEKYLGGAVVSAGIDEAQAQLSNHGSIDLNTQLNFEQRVLNPDKHPVINNPDGSFSTHKMAYGELDGKYVAFPTIVQGYDGGLTELSGKDAFNFAMKNKEYREFDNEKAAASYAEGGYKQSWGKGSK